MIKLKTLTIFCSLFLAFYTFLSADDNLQKEFSTLHIHRNMDYLQLNPTQESEIKEILLSCKKEFSSYYKKKEKAQKKLQKLMQKEYFDEKKYEKTAKKITEEAIELEIRIFKRIHTILTPHQREKFSYYLQEWKIE
ncbi:MAG: Spy/CpxP family protein refolding chaperone [Arcobacteraceae bacterium]